MSVTLDLILKAEMFQTFEHEEAKGYAEKTNGEVYSWKSVCRANWLERGYSRVDTGVLVVLPRILPDCIDMPDDSPDEDDE